MKRVLSQLSLTLTLGIWLVQPAHAEGFSYADYSQNMNLIAQTILDECRADGIGSGVILDQRSFQKTCGVAMRGAKFAGFEANIFFSSEKLENGELNVLGLETRHAVDGEMYSLVRSLNTQTNRPHEMPEITTSSAEATLHVKREQGWQQVWVFVNPHTNDWPKRWHRANPLFPAQQGLAPKVATMIDRLWREVVVLETAKLAFNLHDVRGTRGPVFTARNPKVR